MHSRDGCNHSSPSNQTSCNVTRIQPKQMSLGFIAPGFSLNTDHHCCSSQPDDHHRRSTLPPVRVYDIDHQSTYTRPSLPGYREINNSICRHTYRTAPYPTHPRRYNNNNTPPPSSPSSSSVSSRSRSYSPQFSSRGERHEYDPEERFAVAYLRLSMKTNGWKEVNEGFNYIFPPNERRRASALPAFNNKALPTCYPQRTVGGLECRYYRIRKDEGMKKVREGRREGSSTREADALLRMENKLVKLWLDSLSNYSRSNMGLARLQDESEKDWFARARPTYRSHSDFWRLLSSFVSLSR